MKNICDVRKKHYLCGMNIFVKISCMAVGIWVVASIAGAFDCFVNGVRLVSQTVDCYKYEGKQASNYSLVITCECHYRFEKRQIFSKN